MAENNSNKMITIALAAVICIAAIVLLYTNLPQDNTNDETDNGTPDDNQSAEPAVILTVTYNNTDYNYTLEDLESFTTTTGTGRYVKSKLLPDTVLITPDLNESAWSFTGVAVSTLLDEFNSIPDNYNITVTASDGWTSTYTKEQVDGTIDIYNETGNVTSTTGATMILAYKQDTEYISEDPGPLRISLVGDDIITLSNLWSKMVVSIEIVEL